MSCPRCAAVNAHRTSLEVRVYQLEEALRPFVRHVAPHPEWRQTRPLHGVCDGPTEADLANALRLLEDAT